ncbi:MAG TPA: hypothetical protein ENJ84_07160 [Gammaproteobacteria bacterium]|nr:hypothetical protein [Gammaproteobacteria bacterium]
MSGNPVLSAQNPPSSGPHADAGPEQIVNANEQVILNGRNSIYQGDTHHAAQFYWQQTAGPQVVLHHPTEPISFFSTAGLTTLPALLRFSLTVTDPDQHSHTDFVTVSVRRPGAGETLIQADAGPDQNVAPGSQVMLDGQNSASNTGEALHYQWQQTEGIPVILENAESAHPFFTSPPGEYSKTLGFQLTVNNAQQLSASDQIIINLTQKIPPVAFATGPQTTEEGRTVTLKGGITNDLPLKAIRWTQLQGPPVTLSTPAQGATTFIAPAVSSDQILTFELQATTKSGLQASKKISLQVTDNGHPVNGLRNLMQTRLQVTPFNRIDFTITNGSLVSLNPLDPKDFEDSKNKPEEIPFSVLELTIKTNQRGGTATVEAELFPYLDDNYLWYEYKPEAKTPWQPFSTQPTPNKTFSIYTFDLKDDGFGDQDNRKNGIITARIAAAQRGFYEVEKAGPGGSGSLDFLFLLLPSLRPVIRRFRGTLMPINKR